MNQQIFDGLRDSAHAASAVVVGHFHQVEDGEDLAVLQSDGADVMMASCVEEAHA